MYKFQKYLYMYMGLGVSRRRFRIFVQLRKLKNEKKTKLYETTHYKLHLLIRIESNPQTNHSRRLLKTQFTIPQP